MITQIIIIFVLTICAIRQFQTLPLTSNTLQSLEDIRNAKSEEIRQYMNESVDPCENFFEFACGNWKIHHPKSEASQLVFSDFEHKLQQRLQTVDEMLDSESERKVKDFFQSCMSFSTNQIDFKDNFKKFANEFFQLPALVGDQWKGGDFDWLQTVAEINYKYDIKIIIGIYTGPNIRNHTEYEISLDTEEFSGYLASTYYEIFLNEYLGLDIEEAQQIVEEIDKFTEMLSDADQDKRKNSEITTVQELHEKYYPDLDIRKLMNISMGFIPTGQITNENPSFMDDLIDIMKKTPRKVVANYISMRVLFKFIMDIDPDYTDRAVKCIDQTKEHFKDILSYIFYRTDNLKENEQYVDKMWLEIKSNFQMFLESSALNWFDEKSRQFALEKLETLKFVIPTYKARDFDAVYGQLYINTSDYVENLKSLVALKTTRFRAAIKETVQYTDIVLELGSPVYVKHSNTIVVPISALTTDFLSSPLYPNAFNYGRFGFIISHEVLHGFTGEGRQYNKFGDYQGDWEKDTEHEISQRNKCLYDQYSNYTLESDPHSQDPEQEENAADNAGLVVAYQTYRRWLEDSTRSKEEIATETLPNLHYTNKQLFFISYSQTWCTDTSREARRPKAMDSHSPPQLRAFVPLINFDEFSKEFKCPKGSPMNPIKKCKIY